MTTNLAPSIAENTVCLKNVSWETFNHLLEELGSQRSQRLTYSGGTLEIMTPLGEHEHNNRFIESLILVLTDELNINLKKFGSLTLKLAKLRQAVEPDSCYYITNEPQVRNKQNIDLTIDPPPDLVLEIDITNSSVNKLPIYANLMVPEIWRYNGKIITVFVLDQAANNHTNNYTNIDSSLIFPFLDMNLIPQLIQRSLELGETATLKEFRQWVKKQARD